MTYAGYAYVFQDSKTATCGVGADAKACGTSMGCIEPGFFCGSGTTGIKNGGVTYGAGIGADLGQMAGGAEGGTGEGGPATNVGTMASSANLSFGLAWTNTDWSTATGHNGFEISLDSGGVTYCAILGGTIGAKPSPLPAPTMGMNTVPWSSFVQNCTKAIPGPAFGGMGQTVLSIIFRANAGLAPLPYDFCITSLSI
jgi:hypothetical protein